MTEQQIREIVREIVREEMKIFSPDNLKDMVSEMVAQELLAREDFSNISLTENLTRLGVTRSKNFAGLEAISFAIQQYLETGLKPSKKLYDLLKEKGLSERELRYAKEMAYCNNTPLYRQVFASLSNMKRPPTNTQFIMLAANFYAVRSSNKKTSNESY